VVLEEVDQGACQFRWGFLHHVMAGIDGFSDSSATTPYWIFRNVLTSLSVDGDVGMSLSGRRRRNLAPVLMVAAAFAICCSSGHRSGHSPSASSLTTSTSSSVTTEASAPVATTLVTVPNLVGQVYFDTARVTLINANLGTDYRL